MAMYRCGGSGGGVTPTPITPSNSSPAAMTSGTAYEPTANGYAISSYSEITPSDSSATQLIYNSIYKISGSGGGYAIKSNPIYVSPSNSSPAALTYGKIYRINATDGYAIKNYTPVTPSSTPTSVASGSIVRMDGSGKIVDAISDVTPSDSSPVSLTSGLTYKMGGGGYAIESQPTSKTPDDTTPPSVAVGDIVKITTNGGYLYKTLQSSFSKSLANLGDATLSGSSTKIRDIASYTANAKKTITLISFNASTNCSNNDAYVELYVNGTVKYATSHIPTGSSTINNIVEFVPVNIELNANDVVVLKTNWDNSHTNVNWKFYNIQLGFVQ